MSDPVGSTLGGSESKECPGCEAEITPDEFPYTDGVLCCACGKVQKTDWEESWDSMTWWWA